MSRVVLPVPLSPVRARWLDYLLHLGTSSGEDTRWLTTGIHKLAAGVLTHFKEILSFIILLLRPQVSFLLYKAKTVSKCKKSMEAN